MALGLTTIYNATKVINFGQGEFFVLGAALMYTMSAVNGWNPAVSIVLTLAGAVVMALVSERLIMLPVLRSGSRHAWIIATLALALIFEALFALYYHEAT